MVVGGFPCQDYSVARPLSQAGGIEGEKGVLWWSIYRFLQLKSPKYCLFENVDRLLKSPARQRGRDFAIILSCLANLGYSAEWRVVNSAEYGFPQRRKRVFIYAELDAAEWDLEHRIRHGVMARALPIREPASYGQVLVPDDAYVATQEFNVGGKASPFETAGAMQDFVCATAKVAEDYHGPRRTLGDVLIPEGEVPEATSCPRSSCRGGGTSRAPSASRAWTSGPATPTSTARGPWPSPTCRRTRAGRSSRARAAPVPRASSTSCGARAAATAGSCPTSSTSCRPSRRAGPTRG